jgi:hypothetical protein
VRGSSRRELLSEADVFAAARWRLDGWSAQELERGTALAAELGRLGIPLSGDQPEVKHGLATLPRSSRRRDSWTALAALLVLHADASGDVGLFWRAGFDVVAAQRNGQARSSNGAQSELSEMIGEYQRRRPAATADELFDLWASIAGAHPVIADFASERDVLTYLRNGQLVDVSRDSFRRQFLRIRQRQAVDKESEEKKRTHRVDVRRAA